MYDHAGLLCDLGTAYLLAGRVDESRHLAAEAFALSRSQAARGSEAAALRLAGQVATQSDPPDEATASTMLQEALALAEALGARPAAANCHLALAALHRRAGRPGRARAEVDIAAGEFLAIGMTNSLTRAEEALR